MLKERWGMKKKIKVTDFLIDGVFKVLPKEQEGYLSGPMKARYFHLKHPNKNNIV